jgi:hypothetical protein
MPLPQRAPARALISPPVAALAIACLMVAYVAGYAWSAPNTDSADELMRAYEIRHALAFPLEGPPLGGVLHLGPFWFYLTAIPLFLHQSWLAAALFIGFVCSLKFPLAYHCGRKLLDGDFGLLWAAAMFIPGWSTIEQLVFLNPNAVATAMLLALTVALPGLERPAGLRRCFTLGLVLALALHVHPTALPIFLLAPAVLWKRWESGEYTVPAIIAMGIGFVLPFISYVVSQAWYDFPDWVNASSYVADQMSIENIVNAPAVVSAFFAGPETMAQYVLRWPDYAAEALAIATAGVASLCVVALFVGPVSRKRLAQVLLFLALTAAWIACARPTTPVQFTWALTPLVGALIALGLWSAARLPALRWPVAAIALAGFAINVLLVREMAVLVREGEASLPSLIMDTKGGLSHRLYRDVWFPAHEHHALGRALCNAGGPASLHGHLAYVIDKDLGLDLLFECNDRSQVSLAGSEARLHHFGMSRPFWRAISALPDCWIGSLGLAPSAIPLGTRSAIAVADGSTYLPRRHSGNPPRELLLTFEVPRERAVMITNVLSGYEVFEMKSARAGEVAVIAAAENDFSAIYHAPASATGTVQWTFRLVTSLPNAIDIVSVAGRAGAERAETQCLGR